jgi:uncharacterized protein YmfQ (DUF2313 family)
MLTLAPHAAGIVCGFIGQGIANSLMRLKRHYGTTSEHDVAVPPLMRTALVWGLFMGVSSNSRYQVVFGLERIVDQVRAWNQLAMLLADG